MRIGKLKLFERRVIGSEEDPLLIRWILFRVPAFGIFLHKFCRSDYDRALHDHPWTFVSVILRGGYTEVVEDVTPFGTLEKRLHHRPGSILYRPAEWRHRVVIDSGRPSWNLIFVGRGRRRWGFWLPTGWCWWRKYDYDAAICSEEVLWEENNE